MGALTGVSQTPIAGTARAAVITGPGEVEFQDLEVPNPGPGEVRIKVEGCGVCASNLEIWGGQPWFEYPFEPGAPGHEGWGRVDEIGDGVAGVEVGERAAFLSGHAYAEYDIAKADQLVRLPAKLDGQAVPAEPLGCAMNIFRRSDIQPGQTVAVVGAGFLGNLVTQLAVNAGARVISISRRDFALEMAKQYGASDTIKFGDDRNSVVEQVKQITGEKLCERVIEAVGKQEGLDLATELTGERGKLIVAGYHQDGARQVNMWLWNWRGIDVINAHERDPQVYAEGMRLAIDAVVGGKMDPSPMYTEFALGSLAEALDATRDRPDGFIKAVVKV
jgi:threonine dehydrogenase-like Zn-dependent dehydrogenase